MCFYNEGDWTAQLFVDETVKLDSQRRCSECHNTIHVGVTCRRVFLQEHDYCPECGVEFHEDGTADEPCEGQHDHSYGERDELFICGDCEKVIAAIRMVEEDEGCTGNEAVPAFSQLREAFWESDHAVEYIDRARSEFPELAMNGHLDEFYRLTHEWDAIEEEWFQAEEEPVPFEELGGEG